MSLPYHKPPPHERPNWDGMNEGQRRYAMEQYNLALVRRGAKFDPPQESDEEEDFDIDQFVNDRYNDLGLQHQDSPQASQTSQQSLPTSQENQAADNFLNTIRQNQQMDEHPSQVSSSGSERLSGGPPPKRPRAGAKTSGSALPGTSGNTDGMTAGGSGDGAEQTAPVMPLSRGITNHKLTFTFTKRWKFLTFGIADQILDDVDTSTPSKWNRLALTTSLAAVPWEYAFFYMSPAEFGRMLDYRGVFAKNCNISISQFNPRVAFQTADTTSTTATLNQNKFTRWAFGLRSNSGIYCSDRDYLYDMSEPMKPTGFDTVSAVANRSKLKDAMYGLINTATVANHNLNIPAYATGQELELQQYLTIYTPKTGDNGFPPYDQYCQEGNSMDFLGKEIINRSYDFDYAPLQRKHDPVFSALLSDEGSGNINVSSGMYPEGIFNKSLPAHDAVLPETSFSNDLRYTQPAGGTNVDTTNFENDHMYFKFPMEQSGTYLELNRKPMSYSNQGSIHIGVRAVPKLSTNANLIQTDSWLDTQIYWTVQASLTVEAHDSYFYSRGGPTIHPAMQQLVLCEKSTATPPVFTPVLQTADNTYIAGLSLIHI